MKLQVLHRSARCLEDQAAAADPFSHGSVGCAKVEKREIQHC